MTKPVNENKKDFLIVLDDKNDIQFIFPKNSSFSPYVNRSIETLFDHACIETVQKFMQDLRVNHFMSNCEMTLNDSTRAFFSGYSEESSAFIMVLFEQLSEPEVLKKMIVLNSQQVNEIRALNKIVSLQDDQSLEQISRLNNELLNSRRTIEKQNAELVKYNRLLKKMAVEDSLTGCYNRRYFYDYMRDHVFASQQDETHCLIMIDFNHFKSINDQFGHDAGDRLLIQFVKIAKAILTDIGEVFRLGGDEFIILTNHIHVEDARIMMEKLNNQFKEDSMIATLAYGIVQFKTSDINHEFDLTNILKTTDDLMYEHKKLSHKK